MSDLQQTSDALRNESPKLREKILAGMAKLEGLQDLIASNALQRDGGRLHQKAKAAYKKLGLDVAEDENITNVLGDVTLSQDESRRRSGVSPLAAALLAAAAATAGAVGSQFFPPRADNPAPVVEQPEQPDESYGIRLIP